MEDIFEPICVEVNGLVYRRMVKTNVTLLDFIREDLKLKGTKKSCDNGECGACTVIMNDELVYSCHVLAVQANGAKIVTIEGISQDSHLSPVQEALMDEGAIQCGFCTPGVVMSAKSMLMRNDSPTKEEVRDELSGHFCRCTGYIQFYDAIRIASEKIKTRKATGK